MTEAGTVTVATWNLRWARPRSLATPVIRERLRTVAPEVAVLTEATISMLEPDWAHIAHPGVGVYRGTPADGAKVAIVSGAPLEVVDDVGDPALPPGNFLAVDTETAIGTLRVIGLVVRYDQKRSYLDALPPALERTVDDRTVLAGDFNLAMPRPGLSRRLEGILADYGLTLRTAGEHASLAGERPLIDHIAASESLAHDDLRVWPRRDPRYRDGEVELTDHAGVSLALRDVGRDVHGGPGSSRYGSVRPRELRLHAQPATRTFPTG